MKRNRLILCTVAVSALVAVQSCKKNQSITDQQANPGPVANKKTTAVTGTYNTYTITNVASGYAVEVSGFTNYGQKQDNQRTLQQWQASASTPERWQKWNAVDLGNGYFKLVNLFSGKVLDVPGSSTTQGQVLQQYDWNGSNAQQWQLTEVGFGAYKVINRGNGLALTNEGASTTNGTTITQRSFVNNSSQWWVFNLFSRDSFRDNELTNFFKRTSGSVAFDGVFSIPMTYGANNGKVMWPTNDAWYNGLNAQGNAPCQGGNFPIAYRSTNLVQPAQGSNGWDFNPGSTSNVTSTSNGTQFFPIKSGTSWTWPSGGVEIGSHVYVYGDEGNGLSITSAAIFDINEGSLPSYSVTRLNIPGLNNQTAIRYMHGMVKHTDGYVYVYGAGNTGGFSASDVYVARFPQNSPTSWTYWDGSTWASSPSTASAARIITGMDLGGFWVEKVNGKFVIASMDFGFGCDISQRNVYTRFSSDPKTGFSAGKVVYSLPDYKQNHMPVYYAPAIHPQFTSNNEMVFTYCVNFYNDCLTACSNADGTMDPNDYRAKAVRIPFSLIGI